MMNKFLFLLISLCFSQQISAMSKEYSGGEVYITIKDNSLCFYINNKNISGDYDITLYEQNINSGLYKVGSISSILASKRYPDRKNCITTNEIKDNFKYKDNTPYLVVLETNRFSFGKDFCVDSATKTIQDFSNTCKVKNLSLWEKILNLFDF
ncbi:NF045616 family extracytoplasmic (lipo)protein [Acinetobacter baumannii]|uniref:NF045616 family extracytoplasmic (lipo)protein n=2 Tax=Acinetobacter baumannii TaxID=470 RepID=UPI003879B48C